MTSILNRLSQLLLLATLAVLGAACDTDGGCGARGTNLNGTYVADDPFGVDTDLVMVLDHNGCSARVTGTLYDEMGEPFAVEGEISEDGTQFDFDAMGEMGAADDVWDGFSMLIEEGGDGFTGLVQLNAGERSNLVHFELTDDCQDCADPRQLVGNTINGYNHLDERHCRYFHPNGTVVGWDTRRGEYEGTWSIFGPELCVDEPDIAGELCATLESVSSQHFRFYDEDDKFWSRLSSRLESGDECEAPFEPSRFIVTRIEVDLPSSKENGDAWDSFGGKPDVYFRFSRYKSTSSSALELLQASATLDNRGSSAAWNITPRIEIPADAGIYVQFVDRDGPSADDYISSYSYRPQISRLYNRLSYRKGDPRTQTITLEPLGAFPSSSHELTIKGYWE